MKKPKPDPIDALRAKLEAWAAIRYASAPFKVAKAERELREACLAVWPDFGKESK